MTDVIWKLRHAMAEFDSMAAMPTRTRAAARVLTLVRELLSEVDAERKPEGAMVPDLLAQAYAEPLGPPNPAHGELPLTHEPAGDCDGGSSCPWRVDKTHADVGMYVPD